MTKAMTLENLRTDERTLQVIEALYQQRVKALESIGELIPGAIGSAEVMQLAFREVTREVKAHGPELFADILTERKFNTELVYNSSLTRIVNDTNVDEKAYRRRADASRRGQKRSSRIRNY
jgi:hypothetical protein